MKPTLVWFRKDLRIQDNPALAEAIRSGRPIIPVFLWAPQEEAGWAPGGASRWWLHSALEDLANQLEGIGLRLILRDATAEGSLASLQSLVERSKADTVLWNRRYEPAATARDAGIKSRLREQGLRADSFNASMLVEPTHIANKSGKPFQVFTPMWKHYQTLEMPAPVKVDLKQAIAPKSWPRSNKLKDLQLLPTIAWDGGLRKFWGSPQRTDVLSRFRSFIRSGAESYPSRRDLPAEDGTSLLSPYLHFGQIGPREVWSRLAGAKNHSENFQTGVMRQLIWREFAHHLLYHFPHSQERPLRPEYELFPTQEQANFVRSWQLGETGYPIVDAGMRQLWQTGWMHNRVRMIVGSVLVKHLLQHWTEGARWFWDTLVDADLANNTMGWQWIAGCGADAAPYFRVFNPITQGEKFDPDGKYVRTYVPELKRLPRSFIHRPWELGELELQTMGVTLDKTYPSPVIAHAEGRQQALNAFADFKQRRESMRSL